MLREMLRFSYEALKVIPVQHRRIIHEMYEDSDLERAEEAEALVHWLEEESPGSVVGILANDSVGRTCHYGCDYYDTQWKTVLVVAATWERYKDRVVTAQQGWEEAHGCKHTKGGTA